MSCEKKKTIKGFNLVSIASKANFLGPRPRAPGPKIQAPAPGPFLIELIFESGPGPQAPGPGPRAPTFG
jgi:hypothetical protein